MSLRGRPLGGRVAIVTGASGAIGRAIARRLGRDGAAVTVTHRSRGNLAGRVAEEICANGSEALVQWMDLADLASVRDAFARTLERWGRLDIVVNNAAGDIVLRPTAELTPAEFDAMFAVTRGVYFALQEAARHIADGGRIISVSTAMTLAGRATGGAYAGSKAAIEQFGVALAREIGHRGVTVNTVLPGVTPHEGQVHALAPMGADAPAAMSGRAAQVLAQTPLGRLGTPADIAAVVALLASDDAAWITGQNVRAAGGIV
jgi:3-oxoacyl-[acyl-carrier protein] reductase